MTMRRLTDWPERLHAYLQQCASTQFAWGSHDCARFAAGAVHAITGRDVLPADWRDKAQAVEVLRLLGGLVPAVDASLARLPDARMAQRGDVVLVEADAKHGAHRRWLAVCEGARWCAAGPDGLVIGPMQSAVMAWKV